jgi:hypothetical protein
MTTLKQGNGLLYFTSQGYCLNLLLCHRITTLYQILHDYIHAKSGQGGGLKLQYIRTETESVIGWVGGCEWESRPIIYL